MPNKDRDFDPKEGGFFRVMNEIADKLSTYRLDRNESSLLWQIMRRTWGMKGQAWAVIKWSKLRDKTQLGKSGLHYSLAKLKARNIVKTKSTKKGPSYKINSKTSTWKREKNILQEVYHKRKKVQPVEPTKKGEIVQPVEPNGFNPLNQTVQPVEPSPIKRQVKDKLKDKKSPGGAFLNNKKGNFLDEKFDPELLSDFSSKKVDADLEMTCQKLIEKKIFPRARVFVGMMTKKGMNKKAILHSLARCYLKKTFKEGPWGFCKSILEVENGNYNEKDHNRANA